MRYIVNLDFEGGTHGEIVEAEPALVADWVDAQFLSPVDDRGERVIAIDGVPMAPPPSGVSVERDASRGVGEAIDETDGEGEPAA